MGWKKGLYFKMNSTILRKEFITLVKRYLYYLIITKIKEILDLVKKITALFFRGVGRLFSHHQHSLLTLMLYAMPRILQGAFSWKNRFGFRWIIVRDRWSSADHDSASSWFDKWSLIRYNEHKRRAYETLYYPTWTNRLEFG